MTQEKRDIKLLQNSFSTVLRALAATTCIAVSVGTVRADAVLDWNVIALQTTAAAAFNPPVETRNLAIVHAAISADRTG